MKTPEIAWDKPVNLRVDAELYSRLREIADVEDRPISRVHREILRLGLESKAKAGKR
jgi:predicted transcriptional regulator